MFASLPEYAAINGIDNGTYRRPALHSARSAQVLQVGMSIKAKKFTGYDPL